jgi:hypothetical protein
MLSEFVSSLVATVVVEPLQLQIYEKLQQASVPAAIIEQSQTCLTSQVPKLIERAANEWGWAAMTVVTVSVGITAPADLLDRQDPACVSLVQSLESGESET